MDRHSKAPGTTELLRELLREVPEPLPGEPEPKIALEDLLEQFQQRSFGVFLLISILPTYFAVAVGIGGVSGVLGILCGLQIMLGFNRPWLPKFARSFGLPRRSLANFIRRSEPWIRRLEKLILPRYPSFTEGTATTMTGLVVLLMAIALFLPIPFTNFLFAIPLTILAFALIEGDGLVIAICWVVCLLIVIGLTYLTITLGTSFMHVVIDWLKG